MLIINVTLKVKPEERANYLVLIAELVTASTQEEGCHGYAHYENTKLTNDFAIVEHWENQKAVDQHNETAHFKKFVATIPQYLSEELTISVSKTVD